MASENAVQDQTEVPWLASQKGRLAGHLLWIVGLISSALAQSIRNQWNLPYAFGAATMQAAMVGVVCYLIAIAKPLSNSRLHPGIFGIAMVAVAAYQWLA